MKEQRRAHILVSGIVQGIFFRAHTKNAAQNLDLVGWVRNLRDGRVEIVAEGTKAALEQLLSWCHKGPPHARVDDVNATWNEATGEYTGFEIKY